MPARGSILETLSLATPADAAAGAGHVAIVKLMVAGESIRRTVRGQLAHAGLTIEGFKTLAALRQLDPAPASPSRLAQITATNAAVLSHTLTRLELSRLVTRERDADDRRVVHVRLTPLGHSTVARALDACQDCVHRLVEGLQPADLRHLTAVCDSLHQAALRSAPT